MKRIVYLSYYFKPDLCAGSFRNSTLANELARQAIEKKAKIIVFTTMPNRYDSFNADAFEYEEIENLCIYRISLSAHKSGLINQAFSFIKYSIQVLRINKNLNIDLVFASSSRLFTAFLGYIIAKKSKAPLYLDIRDIFIDTINNVYSSMLFKISILPVLKVIERHTFSYASHINLISGGFETYFSLYKKSNFSFFTNGVDDEFLNRRGINEIMIDKPINSKLIVYAGNIGEGQGLHKIIPKVAQMVGDNYKFLIIGDGATKKNLQLEIENLQIKNVEIRNPISRESLQKEYDIADYLLIHLNDFPAFRKVLPSKLFELTTFNKPILAGVSGYAAQFINTEVSNSFVFEPCNVEVLGNHLLSNKEYTNINRKEFVRKFMRSNINQKMAASILMYL